MTNPDFRAELQRLVEAYDEHGGKWPDHHEQALFQAVKNARAALAQPVTPTLKKQALEQLREVNARMQFYTTGGETSAIRSALEALPND
jgi:hypothetical protein